MVVVVFVVDTVIVVVVIDVVMVVVVVVGLIVLVVVDGSRVSSVCSVETTSVDLLFSSVVELSGINSVLAVCISFVVCWSGSVEMKTVVDEESKSKTIKTNFV